MNASIAASTSALIAPHGGHLRELYLPPEAAEALKKRAAQLPQWTLSERQLCDLELLLNGGFSPLSGFLGEEDYRSVVNHLRLADGTLWPMPITLDVPEALAAQLQPGSELSLNDTQGTPLAVLEISDIYRPDREHEAQQVFGSNDRLHPGVAELLDRNHPVNLGGRLLGIQPPAHYDFVPLRRSPRQLRAWFTRQGWNRIVAFQTRNPMHRAHRELTLRAAEKVGARLLIQPVVGRTKPGDIDHYTRVRCYQALLPHYPEDQATLSLLPLAMRMGGPREALWHALIRQNFGASHFIVGRDHAGPGKNAQSQPFYGPFEAHELIARYQHELGIEVVTFPAMVYAANRDAYLPAPEVTPEDEVRDISGTELRRRLHQGEDIPAWFTFPEVVRILRERHPAGARPGFTLFFTGLSGAGKSTLAQAVVAHLLETGSRAITVLDGDEVRLHLSKGLGFSREDRDTNIARIGYVASEVVRHGGIAICAPIAPYTEARARARALVAAHGRFVEIHVATPLEVCEQRDRKGLYAKARAGKLTGFTGIDDPYEIPAIPELRIDASQESALDAARRIVTWLRSEQLL